MPIGEVCNREVVTCAPATSALEAAKSMRAKHVGALVVVEEKEGKPFPIGVVTDRDLVVTVMAMGLDPRDFTVADIMRAEVITATESTGLLEAIELMRAKGIRRLPVVNDEGVLSGIVAVDDIIGLLAEELQDLSKVIAHEQAHEREVRRYTPQS